ncbi:MAG: 4Fe-4S binding protein [Candidatus Margulisiibacteriota bacterium]
MGHLTFRNYSRLQKRLDQFPQGVFNSQDFYEILKLLFADEEAKLCSVMPLHFFTAKEMAGIWDKGEEETKSILKTLGDKGLVYSRKKDGILKYFLFPPMIGFFEFSMMRLDNRFDKKKLAELYYKYINLEDSFLKKLVSLDPYFTRVFPHEEAIKDIKTEVLSHEKISAMIKNSRTITVGTCFCRHKMEHMGMACDNPQEVCLTFDGIAEDLLEHGIARKISKEEARKIVEMCIERGLVQLGDNIKNELSFICNCCSCCCDVLLGYKRFGPRVAINPSNYIARINNATCRMCGTCVKRCPVDAISIVKGKVKVNRKVCIGCGVCTRFCSTGSAKMEIRSKKTYIPENTIEMLVLQAIGQNKIGNFIFDDQTSRSHAILRKVVNLILRFPPIKMILKNPRVVKFLLKKSGKT